MVVFFGCDDEDLSYLLGIRTPAAALKKLYSLAAAAKCLKQTGKKNLGWGSSLGFASGDGCCRRSSWRGAGGATISKRFSIGSVGAGCRDMDGGLKWALRSKIEMMTIGVTA